MKKILLLLVACYSFAGTGLVCAGESKPIQFLNSVPTDSPFSEAVRVGNILFLSGQVGFVPGTRKLVAGGIKEEARQTRVSACEGCMNPDTPGRKAGSECTTYWYNSWVNVVSEIKNLLGKAPSLLRICQALGLPVPASGQSLDNTCAEALATIFPSGVSYAG